MYCEDSPMLTEIVAPFPELWDVEDPITRSCDTFSSKVVKVVFHRGYRPEPFAEKFDILQLIFNKM